jgi:hypothetical protein
LIDHILNAIDEEIAKLRQARALLAGHETAGGTASKASSAAASGLKPRRTLSAKARRAIAEAQRKRWAKVKSQRKATAPAAAARKEATAG